MTDDEQTIQKHKSSQEKVRPSSTKLEQVRPGAAAYGREHEAEDLEEVDDNLEERLRHGWSRDVWTVQILTNGGWRRRRGETALRHLFSFSGSPCWAIEV